MKYIMRIFVCWVRGRHTYLNDRGVSICKHCEKKIIKEGRFSMLQIYCDNEKGINKWLSEHHSLEIVDIKMSMNNEGEFIMVIYKTDLA